MTGWAGPPERAFQRTKADQGVILPIERPLEIEGIRTRTRLLCPTVLLAGEQGSSFSSHRLEDGEAAMSFDHAIQTEAATHQQTFVLGAGALSSPGE
jgi:hypothetical protein